MKIKTVTSLRLLAVPFQSVEGASESRKQARRDWSERTSGITFARSVDHRSRICSPIQRGTASSLHFTPHRKTPNSLASRFLVPIYSSNSDPRTGHPMHPYMEMATVTSCELCTTVRICFLPIGFYDITPNA